jgi:predicted O-methyltransferase YrrM
MQYPNWFHSNIPTFEKFLNKYKNLPNVNFLQIGVYLGHGSEWLLKNILTEKTSRLTDIDTWKGSKEKIHQEFDWNEIESIYDEKINQFSNVKKVKKDSKDYLSNCDEEFDFIYIDGDHSAEGVYSDAVLAFPLLKSGGILAFDDYLWEHPSKNVDLKPLNGIDKFLKNNELRIKILQKGYQVWIKKL